MYYAHGSTERSTFLDIFKLYIFNKRLILSLLNNKKIDGKIDGNERGNQALHQA
jgi:hypothetical protein